MEYNNTIYDRFNQPSKVVIPNEIETMYYETYGHYPKKKFFRTLKKRR